MIFYQLNINSIILKIAHKIFHVAKGIQSSKQKMAFNGILLFVWISVEHYKIWVFGI
jgi:hypothetical protein